MKVIIKKEYDGTRYVGSCENLPGCFTQSHSAEELMILMRRAIELYRKSYADRQQPLPQGSDFPYLDKKIRFHKISAAQLTGLLQKSGYHLEHQDDGLLLFRKMRFPFNRLVIPNASEISPLIISKIFSKENVIYVNKRPLNANTA
ncbi:MAG: type II toxin-antitoxin system HicB family antitoxin [Calditrichaeota bacterium]|nr:MAG: type II toxin-antitoxin system HicB family antitoxin [Calditrichota bacterium]